MSHLLVSVIVLIQERDGARDFQSFLSTSIYVTVTPVPKVRKKNLVFEDEKQTFAISVYKE